ncbi:endonuclease domain-containing protein [Altererythrobacter palmitatis]|uniref:Endonuclease domain-containing protein n=1 Tax=Alteraurantiacibacter palmitatis TaxID=2054628 RepID=A0ABV7E8F9_9SPHN
MAEKRLTSLARELRNNPTEAEKLLWQHLCASQFCGVKFTRQCQIGGFIVDFACRRLRIAIELDGGQHAESCADGGRTQIIEAHGYRVIRFWNSDVLGNIDGVLQVIAHEIAIARNQC